MTDHPELGEAPAAAPSPHVLLYGRRAEPAWSTTVDRLMDCIGGVEQLFGPAVAGQLNEAAWELRREVELLVEALQQQMADVEEAKRTAAVSQQLVADMHSAAVGEVRGPIRGVVEDVAAVREALVRALDDVDQGYTEAAVELAAAKAEADCLREAITRWKRNHAVHPDTANRALRAARDARDAAAEAAASGEPS